jgi:hypothetical protein
MKAPECPCRNCADRQAGCHSSCAKYTKWKSEYTKYSKAVKENRMQEYIMRDYEAKKHRNLKKIMAFYTVKKK